MGKVVPFYAASVIRDGKKITIKNSAETLTEAALRKQIEQLQAENEFLRERVKHVNRKYFDLFNRVYSPVKHTGGIKTLFQILHGAEARA